MTNDTSTLNGALTELGETMADNLVAMGVTGASASDGLTTLAGKILDIEPSVGGLDLTSEMSLTVSSNSITLGQSVVLTATLTANYDDETLVNVDLHGYLQGATVTFKNGANTLGTGTTDVNGVATYTYTPLSTGTLSLTAVFAGTDNFSSATSSSVSVSVVAPTPASISFHSDDNGLVLPPKLAPIQVAIVPICKNDEQMAELDAHIAPLIESLKAKGLTVKYDNRTEYKPGWKFSEYEFKGVPVRLAIGPRDLENGTCEVCRRDTLEKVTMPIEGIADHVLQLMDEIQKSLLQRAKDFRAANTRPVDTWEQFLVEIEKGGFLLCHWDGTVETEEKIKELTKATIRCIPYDAPEEEGKCVFSGKPSHRRVIFARSY